MQNNMAGAPTGITMFKTLPHTHSLFTGILSLAYFACSAAAGIYLYTSWTQSEPSAALQLLGVAGVGYALLTAALLPLALKDYGYTARSFNPATQRVIRQTALWLPLPVLAIAGFQFFAVTTFDGSSSAWERLHATGDLVRALGGEESSNKWWAARTEELLARKYWSDAFHSSAHIHACGTRSHLASDEKSRVMMRSFADGDFVISELACRELIDGSESTDSNRIAELKHNLEEILCAQNSAKQK